MISEDVAIVARTMIDEYCSFGNRVLFLHYVDGEGYSEFFENFADHIEGKQYIFIYYESQGPQESILFLLLPVNQLTMFISNIPNSFEHFTKILISITGYAVQNFQIQWSIIPAGLRIRNSFLIIYMHDFLMKDSIFPVSEVENQPLSGPLSGTIDWYLREEEFFKRAEELIRKMKQYTYYQAPDRTCFEYFLKRRLISLSTIRQKQITEGKLFKEDDKEEESSLDTYRSKAQLQSKRLALTYPCAIRYNCTISAFHLQQLSFLKTMSIQILHFMVGYFNEKYGSICHTQLVINNRKIELPTLLAQSSRQVLIAIEEDALLVMLIDKSKQEIVRIRHGKVDEGFERKMEKHLDFSVEEMHERKIGQLRERCKEQGWTYKVGLAQGYRLIKEQSEIYINSRLVIQKVQTLLHLIGKTSNKPNQIDNILCMNIL